MNAPDRSDRVRVVSLVPSVTETLAAWGVEPVACTRFCERPDLTHVGGTKNPDIDAIVRLAPDVVIVDRQENRRDDAAALGDHGLDVVAVDVRSIESLGAELDVIARAVGVKQARRQVAEVIADLPRLSLRAFVPIWRRPWMSIGAATYGSSVLAALGVENVFADAPVDYPEVTLDGARTRSPDLVLVPSEPYGFSDDHLEEMSVVARPVRVDGQDLFWWGARTPDALRRLHAAITSAAGAA